MNQAINYNSPVLKWAGGKYRLLNTIFNNFPETIAGSYIEPFVGAGSVALNVKANKLIVNDFNADLSLFWSVIKSNLQGFLKETNKLFDGSHNHPDSYYRFRTEFNTTAHGVRRAALFYYLNKHCFNGLCRYNKDGKFNTPVGKYAKVAYDVAGLTQCSANIQNWEIHNKDFRDILRLANKNDVVYCDPPYVPLSNTAYFTSYSPKEFNFKDQQDLAFEANEAAKRGALVLISNHDTPESQALYRQYTKEIVTFDVARTISAKSASREKAKELIAVFQ